MIVSLLLKVLSTFLTYTLGQLPQTGFSTTITDGIHSFYQSVYSFNSVMPIDTVISLMGYSVIFWSLVLLWDGIKWLIHLIRGN